MQRRQGWLLDLYPTPTGMALWTVGQDGSRRCYRDELLLRNHQSRDR